MVSPLPPLSALTAAAPAAAPLSSDRVALEIISSTVNLRAERTARRIEGTVERILQDRVVIIKTDRGTITARAPDDVPLKTGQPIEIEIPPDRSGTTKTADPVHVTLVRPGAAAPPATTTKTPPDPAATVPPRDTDVLQGPARLRDMAAARGDTPTRPRELAPGQIVPLRPLSLAEVMATIRPSSGGHPSILTQLPPAVLSSLTNLTTALNSGAGLIKTNTSLLTGAWAKNFLLNGTPTAPPVISTSARITQMSPATVSFADSFWNMAALPRLAAPPTTMLAQLETTAMPRFSVPTPTNPVSVLLNQIQPGGAVFLHTPVGADASPIPSLVTPGTALPTATANIMVMIGTIRENGAAILSTPPLGNNIDPPGFYVLDGAVAPPRQGAIITYTPQSFAPSSPLPMMPAGADNAWINALLQTLTALDPAGLETIYGAAARPPMPTATVPQQMGAAMLFFLAVLRSGDIQNWLGDRAVESLRRSPKGAAALDKLASLMDNARQKIETAPIGEWRSFTVPLVIQSQILPLALHMRREDNDNDDQGQSGGKGQRFVLDLSFDRMGTVQMDMLYRPGNLESILRTELPLSMAMRGVLERKYAAAMVKTNLAGALNFQDGKAAWVTITSFGAMPEKLGLRV